MDKTILGIVIGTFIVLGAIILFATRQGGEVNPGELQGDPIEDQGRSHISVGADHPPYNSNPPTSGWHWPQPAPWGSYDEEQPDEQLIHNLEHGGVNVFYRPDLPKDQVDRLKDLVRPYRVKVILAPRAANDTPIAMTSWGRILKLETFDEQRISTFVRNNRNRGPEFVPE